MSKPISEMKKIFLTLTEVADSLGFIGQSRHQRALRFLKKCETRVGKSFLMKLNGGSGKRSRWYISRISLENILAPDNSFTTLEDLMKEIKELKLRIENLESK